MTQAVLIGWGILAGCLALLWAWQVSTRDATSVDVAWSAGLAALALLYPWLVEADPARRVLVSALGFVWAFRLAWFLLTDRVLKHTGEDGRPFRSRLAPTWSPLASPTGSSESIALVHDRS